MVKKASKPAANHLRAWRLKEGLSQDKLAAIVGTAGNVIGLLESGERTLSEKWLKVLAKALNTQPGHLRDYDPKQLPSSDILSVWASIPDQDKPKALQVLEAFREKG